MVCACVFVTVVTGGQESSGVRCDCFWVDGGKDKQKGGQWGQWSEMRQFFLMLDEKMGKEKH